MAGGNIQEVINPMEILIVIIAAVILVSLAAAGIVSNNRRKLRESFGPEYEQVAQEHGSGREADRELQRRKHEHDKLDLRPVSPQDQEFYAASWDHLQAEFLDNPALSLDNAEHLVAQLLDFRGYPGEDPNEQLALLSVEHAESLADYRTAQGVSRQVHEDASSASTEEIRQALLSYHVLFDDLLADSSVAHA